VICRRVVQFRFAPYPDHGATPDGGRDRPGLNFRSMNILLLIIVLLLLFGGGGFYFGGPAIGGGGLGLVLLIVLVIYLMGGFRTR
jgi:hypothetical protein